MIEFNFDNHFKNEKKSPDLTPLIDMVFILLIFFLLTSFALQPFIRVELPEAENTQSGNYRGLRLSVKADGSLVLNGQSLTLPELLPVLEKAKRENPEVTLNVEADRQAAFGQVINVMDEAKKAGFSGLNLPVEKRQ
ncbi:MAG: biopolymer transporter ExbD [Spirochaetales bacterium]|nr:biopolymer transporter ExbD [Spirochaetales bacterium]